MAKIGEKFKEYKTFGIKHIAIPDTGSETEVKFLDKYGLDKNQLPEIMPTTEPYVVKTGMEEMVTFRVLTKSISPHNLIDELDKIVVGVAPTAHVYPIPEDKIPKDLEDAKDTFSAFNYYVVELGLNVLLDEGVKIPELLFEVDLKCDSGDRDRTDVTAYDIMPDDRIKHIKIVDGKISLDITKLLKFLPAPLGKPASDVLDINISREFKWGFDKYEIDAAGEKDYHIYWKIYETNVTQGFNPRMIIKARKGVGEITATARCIYKLKKWYDLLDLFLEIKSDDKEIKIWPL